MVVNDKHNRIVKEVFGADNGAEIKLLKQRILALEYKIEFLLKDSKVKQTKEFLKADEKLKSKVSEIEDRIKNIINPEKPAAQVKKVAKKVTKKKGGKK